MNSIIDILSKAGIPYKTAPHKNIRRNWVGVDCPKCSPGHDKYRLGFELTSARAHCWICGNFYAPEILSILLRIPQRDVYDLLGKIPKYKPTETTHTGTLKIPSGVGPLLPCHRAYLESRGLRPDDVARIWGIGGIGMAVRLPWRLYIPVHDRYGQVVSWTTRATGTDPITRYYSATEEEEAIPHKTLLYGAHLARHSIVILEGPIDAWTIGPGAVATLGVGYTAIQKSLMGSFPVRIVCFDAEEDAQRRARVLCDELSLLPGTTENICLESGKDANSADPAEIRELREKYFPENL